MGNNTNSPFKKVLLVITKSNFGGAQRYVFDLAVSLAKRGYEVSVAAGGSGVLFEKLHNHGIKTIPIPLLERDVSLFKEWKVMLSLYRLFRMEKPDIVHVNSSKIGGVGAVAARLAGIPRIVFTAHGWAFNEDRSSLSKIAIKLLYWIIMLCNHAVIAVSDTVAAQVKSFPLVQKKIRVIKNGIEKDEHDIIRQEARILLSEKIGRPIAEDTVVIGTISELHHIKGIEYAIEAIAETKRAMPEKDIVFLVAGDGDYRSAIEAKIRELSLGETVFLLGYLHNAPRYLSGFDIFTLSSLSEGLGYVLLEAGMAKLPVIASDVGGIPEIVENNVSGSLVPPKDSAAISKSIEKHVAAPSVATHYGEALHRKVTQEFSLEKMVDETINLYMKK